MVRCVRRSYIAGRALTKLCPISCPERFPATRTNARTPAYRSACRSWGRERICLSFIKTIQPCRPTWESHSVSGVLSAKCEAWISTCTPACRRASGTTILPQLRSIKKTYCATLRSGASRTEGLLLFPAVNADSLLPVRQWIPRHDSVPQ